MLSEKWLVVRGILATPTTNRFIIPAPLTSDALHIFNARIWTGDRLRPWAQSITMIQGRVAEFDQPPDHACGFAPPLQVINARGKTVTPGMIDSHLHVLSGGKSLNRLDLSQIQSRREFEAAIARRHAELPGKRWLIAFGWSQENWPGHAMPTKDWLSGSGARPTVCYRMDMHAALVNDAVLKLCDLRRDPPGGRIERAPDTHKPTGLLIEAAAWHLVNPLVPEPDVAGRQKALLEAQRYLHSLGITGVGSMEYWRDVQDVYVPLRDQLTLRTRITLLDRDWPLEVRPAIDFNNDDQLAIIGFKAFIDGTLGSRTARMFEDYADDPGNRGMLVELTANGRLNEWANFVAKHNLSPSMHAIGDEAVHLALDGIDSIPTSLREKVRPRIEHAQQIAPDDILRFMGRIASMQPLHKADDCRYVRQRLGDSRLGGTFAFRKLLNAGAMLAFGSDWPVVSPDPLAGIRAAVTGLTLDNEVFGAHENLSVEEALRAYTTDAAHCLRIEDAGVLRTGAMADCVMFDRDPFAADWINKPPRAEMTIANGCVVYDAHDGRDEASTIR